MVRIEHSFPKLNVSKVIRDTGSGQFSISKCTWNYSHRSREEERERHIDRKSAYLAAYYAFIEAGRGITSKARDNIVSRVQHNQSSSTGFASRDPRSTSVTTRDTFLLPTLSRALLLPTLSSHSVYLSNNGRVDCTRYVWQHILNFLKQYIISQILLITVTLVFEHNFIY